MDFSMINDNKYEYNRAQTLVFLNLMNKLMHADYEQRLEIIKETWGEVKDFPKVFYYGDYCSIMIFKEDDKVKFKFDCTNTDLEVLKQGNPDFGEQVAKKFKEKMTVDKEDVEFSKLSTKDECEHQFNKAENSVSNDYINLYRNINFKK